jgi:MoaD family protein
MKLKIKLLKPFSTSVGKDELYFNFKGIIFKNFLEELVSKYPNLKKELFNKNNELTEYVCIFVNDKPISSIKGIDTKLKDGDEILFFIPISGG